MSVGAPEPHPEPVRGARPRALQAVRARPLRQRAGRVHGVHGDCHVRAAALEVRSANRRGGGAAPAKVRLNPRRAPEVQGCHDEGQRAARAAGWVCPVPREPRFRHGARRVGARGDGPGAGPRGSRPPRRRHPNRRGQRGGARTPRLLRRVRRRAGGEGCAGGADHRHRGVRPFHHHRRRGRGGSFRHDRG